MASGNFADIAKQMGGESCPGIQTPLFTDQIQFGKFDAVGLHKRNVPEGGVFLDHNGLTRNLRPRRFHPFGQLFRILIETGGNRRQVRL